MIRRPARVMLHPILGALLLFAALPGQAEASRKITFEERVAAEEAIQRLYHAHQIGGSQSFEQTMPRAMLEQRVRTYLQQSVALEEFWNTPVTAEMLQAELERMVHNTRFPDRLAEIFRALGEDPVLVLECFARPTLTNRLTRSFFASDRRIHREALNRAEQVREAVLAGDDEGARLLSEVSTVEISVRPEGEAADDATIGLLRYEAAGMVSLAVDAGAYREWKDSATWAQGGVGRVIERRDSFAIRQLLLEESGRLRVRVYVIPKVAWDTWWLEASTRMASSWQTLPIPDLLPSIDVHSLLERGRAAGVATPSACYPDDTWNNGTLDDVPERRSDHSTVWTGTRMLIWGGYDYGPVNTGGSYDPLTDTWSPAAVAGAPTGRYQHSAVWTGSRMIVWGGLTSSGQTSTGGSYDPIADAWSVVSMSGAPSARSAHRAVWTGSRMLVWGGMAPGNAVLATGGGFAPATNTWTPIATLGAPSARISHAAHWTGSRLLVWGGITASGRTDTGASYDPLGNSWEPMSTLNAPSARSDFSSIWSGDDLIVWGGDLYGEYTNTGARYEPEFDRWTAISVAGAPIDRRLHAAVWTGAEMIVWGGERYTQLNDGGRYDPGSDTWSPMSGTNAPSPRGSPSAVWTGTLMVIWSGDEGGISPHLNTGGRYDPVADAWTPTSTGGSPPPSYSQRAVWTGVHMVVWGGHDWTNYTKAGGRYDPVADAWLPSTTVGAPAGREGHAVVWTGARMIVWGGYIPLPPGESSSEAAYDPLADRWFPYSMVGAPVGALFGTAVWTGTEMLVWGGSTTTNVGGRYDPNQDAWSAMTSLDAPEARDSHTAVWTGSEMVVWGGYSASGPLGTGGRYDPTLDHWAPVATSGAPVARSYHTAVWIGGRMVVWGGRQLASPLASGGRYDPATDSWTATSTVGAPTGRRYHTAVSTGRHMIVWGGEQALNTGGRYEPISDTWAPVTTQGAPPGQQTHAALWTGEFMLVWGGGATHGGRYTLDNSVDLDGDGLSTCGGDCLDTDPSVFPGATSACDGKSTNCSDPAWPLVPMAEVDGDGDGFAPCGRVVHGGTYSTPGDCDDATSTTYPEATELCNDRDDDCDGAYLAVETDDDGDGLAECAGDCDDGDAAMYPGNTEACDARDNDCTGSVDGFVTFCGTGGCAAVGWCVAGADSCVAGVPVAEACNGLDDDCSGSVPATEVDRDHDGVRVCAGDCDDANPLRQPGRPEACDSIDNDCDGVVPPVEADADGDGFRGCQGDCDDADAGRFPWAPEVCNRLDDDCEGTLLPDEEDPDGDDVAACQGDCDATDPFTYPGAPEVQDGEDNQCPGDAGYGLIEEISGISGFTNPFDRDEFCWPPQDGATEYEVARSHEPDFATTCGLHPVSVACWSDPSLPPARMVFAYLVRAAAPGVGSWGEASSGVERVVPCGAALRADPVSTAEEPDEVRRRHLGRDDHGGLRPENRARPLDSGGVSP